MKEKVLYVSLPEGAEYLRVEVAEDGKIGIVYTEKARASKTKTTKAAPAVVKSKAKSKAKWKPEPLIGGTPVYQKDNGTGYWYCKIKGGRDEFMYLYFEDLTEDDLLYDANGKKRNFVNYSQEVFKKGVLEALKNKPEEGFRWLPVYAPSIYQHNPVTRKIRDCQFQYIAGKIMERGLDSYEWFDILEKYSPENGSQKATLTTCYLLGLRWLKDGIATIDQLNDESIEIPPYTDWLDPNKKIEKAGEREFGGLYSLMGNFQCEVDRKSVV